MIFAEKTAAEGDPGRKQVGNAEMLTHCVHGGISRMKQGIHCFKRTLCVFDTDTVTLPTVQKVTRKTSVENSKQKKNVASSPTNCPVNIW